MAKIVLSWTSNIRKTTDNISVNNKFNITLEDLDTETSKKLIELVQEPAEIDVIVPQVQELQPKPKETVDTPLEDEIQPVEIDIPQVQEPQPKFEEVDILDVQEMQVQLVEPDTFEKVPSGEPDMSKQEEQEEVFKPNMQKIDTTLPIFILSNETAKKLVNAKFAKMQVDLILKDLCSSDIVFSTSKLAVNLVEKCVKFIEKKCDIYDCNLDGKALIILLNAKVVKFLSQHNNGAVRKIQFEKLFLLVLRNTIKAYCST